MKRLAAVCLERIAGEEQTNGRRVEAADTVPTHPLAAQRLSRRLDRDGAGQLWQDAVVAALRDEPLTLLNPRRDDRDARWEQSSANPQCVAQVTWELDAQERADLIAMYFYIRNL
jgi:hypothetical protein